MSYDVWVACPHCHRGEADYNWNYTSNCSPMWRLAGADLADFNGWPAGACAPILREAIARMEADPAPYIALNPSNGWGSYETLVPRLKKLLRVLEEHPDDVVRVCG